MANTKISDETLKTVPVSADVTIIVDSVGGENKKITLGTIPALSAQTVTGFSPTSGKTLTVQKSITLTCADDTAVTTLPAGAKTLVATDGNVTGSSGSCTGNSATATKWGAYAGIAGPTQARTFTLPDADSTLLANIVEDTTPQLGGNLDLNDKQILHAIPTADVTANGDIISVTVDTNAEGIGAPLFMAADGHMDTADADGSTTAPCVALALETGTGTKKVLLRGVIRNDAWNWTIGPGAAGLIYLSTTVGTMTQTQPTGTDDVIQILGWAISADVMYFSPQYDYITHT